jgi:hypothetical protein
MPGDVLRVCARACGRFGVRHRPRIQCAKRQSVHEGQIGSVVVLISISHVTSQTGVPFEASIG